MQRLAVHMNAEARAAKGSARTQAQKKRILAAAQACFVESGFHAASMASIAKTAGMSPGLIYRYFENKNSIILALIEQQLEIARSRIRELHASKDLAARMVDYFEEQDASHEDSMSTALFLETSAEATRDPEIARVLRGFDAMVRSEVAGWLARGKEQGGHDLPADVSRIRAFLILCLIEGLKVRGVREPELDRKLLRKALDEIIASLLAPPGVVREA